MPKYKIIKWYNGRYGYKESYSLFVWNPVYNCYTQLKFSLRLQFIFDYCLLHNIENHQDFPIEER